MMKTEAAPRLVLQAQTAADLMTPSPVSIRDTATVAELMTGTDGYFTRVGRWFRESF